MAYIASVLRSEGIEVDLVDLFALDREVDFSPYDYIGIYANTICFERGTKPLLERIKASSFKGKILMGGPHTSVSPETIPDYVDYIVQGEGEEVILGIIRGDYQQRIIRAERIKDIDCLPRPAYDLFADSLADYNLSYGEYPEAKKVFTYSSSRGCTFNCTFCSAKNIFGRIWTAHSPERMVDDIEFLIAEYGVDGIYFREDNFTININRVREFCRLVLDRGLKFTWKCETRVNMKFEDLKLMYDAGLRVVYVGFESGSEKNLKSREKTDTRKRIGKVCRRLQKVGDLYLRQFYYRFADGRRGRYTFDRRIYRRIKTRPGGPKQVCGHAGKRTL